MGPLLSGAENAWRVDWQHGPGRCEPRDRWRHPEQFIEEKAESGWREATVEEIANEA